MGVPEEIAEMNKMRDALTRTQDSDDDVQSTDAPSTETPDDDLEFEFEGEGDGEGESETSTDAPSTDSPSTDAPLDRDKEIDDLRKSLAEKVKPSTQAPSTDAPAEPALLDFFSEDEFDDLVREPEKLKEVLNKVYKRAMADAKSQASVSSDSVKRAIEEVENTKAVVKQFYDTNKDLVEFKGAVGAVFDEVAAEFPGLGYNDLMPLVAMTTRKKLNLPTPPKESSTSGPDTKQKGKSPKLPKKGGRAGARQTETKSKTSTQSQIDEMNKSLRR